MHSLSTLMGRELLSRVCVSKMNSARQLRPGDAIFSKVLIMDSGFSTRHSSKYSKANAKQQESLDNRLPLLRFGTHAATRSNQAI
jgi:hypothetical protein